jgi:hypothetical protein
VERGNVPEPVETPAPANLADDPRILEPIFRLLLNHNAIQKSRYFRCENCFKNVCNQATTEASFLKPA